MTNYELLIRHLNRHNITILMQTSRLIMWQYEDTVTIDTFNANGKAIGRTYQITR